MKIHKGKYFFGIEYGPKDIHGEHYYWTTIQWMKKDSRYWGYHDGWYDGPLWDLGLWYINFSGRPRNG